MGECGCGALYDDRGFILPEGKVLSHGLYRGCDDCYQGIGITLHFWDSSEVEFLAGVELQKPKFDKYGGNEGQGYEINLFEVEDLIEAAKELWSGASIGDGEDDYETLMDWLHDWGLEFIQKALDRNMTRRNGNICARH